MLLRRSPTSALIPLLAIASLSCSTADTRGTVPLAREAAAATRQTPTSEQAPIAAARRVRDRLPDPLPELHAAGVIGILGGTVELAGHSLDVPAGAVSLPTLFSITVVPNGYVEVEISAVLTTLFGRVVDAGERGLRKPVPLSLTYARATNVTRDARVRIARLYPDGRHEPLPGTVDPQRRRVTTHLDRFARYALIAD